MELLVPDKGPSKRSETWFRRHLKPLIVVSSLVAALFLTIGREGPDGRFSVGGQRTLRAAADEPDPNYDLAALKVFTIVLGRVKDHYVDAARIHPRQMLIAALNAIERSVAEVMVEEQQDGTKVVVKVQDAERSFDIKGVDSPWSLLGRMKAVVRFVRPNLAPSTNIRDVEYSAINGMLSTLDPHSVLLNPEIYKEMKLSTRGEFGGLGIVISMIQGVLTVMKPMKGTPAYQVGIRACDQILKIGEESTVSMTLSQAVARLRGAPGSTVEVTIRRAGWKLPVRKVLTRAVIKVPSVTSRMLGKQVGYVRLSSFQGNSHADLLEHLRRLKRKSMKGLVLDLRGNPGGLLDQAIKVADLFIDNGTLLTTVAHAGKQREDKRASREGTEGRYPIVVLVDSGSASASEIVAGALKNLDRAVVVGTSTFGKGSVQVLYDNDDASALKLTIAQYLTPGDVSIQSVGITPDIETRPAVVRKDFVKLHGWRPIARESDLRQHLTHENVRPDVKPARVLRYLAPPATDKAGEKPKQKNLCLFPDRTCKAEDDDKFVEDFQIRLARDLVASAGGWRRAQILEGAKALFETRQAEEVNKIAKELRRLGVDWTASTAAVAQQVRAGQGSKKAQAGPKLAVRVDGRQAKACQRMRLRVNVTNNGREEIERLEGVTESENKLFSGHEFPFGRLGPGQSRSWMIELPIRDAPTRMDSVTLNFRDSLNRKYVPSTFQVSTKGVARPTFAYGYQLIDDPGGNRDGRAQKGESLRLLVKVRNTGTGRAFRAVTTLQNLSGPGIFVRKGRFVIGRLEPGHTKAASFTFEVKPDYKEEAFKLDLKVFDDGLGEYVHDKLRFPIAQTGTPVPTSAPVRTVRVSTGEKVPLRAWAAKDAQIVAEARSGAAFRVLGELGDWYRVAIEDDRPVFVAKSKATAGGRPTRRNFTSRWQVTPPKLKLTVKSHITEKSFVKLSGEATDETRVSDLFIFVRNPGAKVEGRKVFYRSNRHSGRPNRLGFDTKVPLWPGANYITVFARESEDVQAQEMVVIFRRKKSTATASR